MFNKFHWESDKSLEHTAGASRDFALAGRGRLKLRVIVLPIAWPSVDAAVLHELAVSEVPASGSPGAAGQLY